MTDITGLPARLEELLRRNGAPADLKVSDVKPISGGYSLLTYGFTATSTEGTRRHVLRTDPPAGAALTATDRAHEWELLAELTAKGVVPMPAALAYRRRQLSSAAPASSSTSSTGPSSAPTPPPPPTPSDVRLAGHLAETLAAVHGAGVDAAPDSYPRPDSWDDYVDDLIGAWRNVEANHAECNPFLRYVACWLEAHKPPPAPLTLVHGEFQTGNVMIDAQGRMQVIDWEYAHIGDPRFDLGWCQNVAAFAPPDLIGLDPMAFCARYCELTGASPAVVNPLTVGYFAILAGAKDFGALLAGIAAMARGENHLLTTAYLVSAEPFTHRLWMGGTRQLEAAMAVIEAHMQPGRMEAS